MRYDVLRPTLIGPQLAESLLSEPPYQFQRKVKQNTVDFYADQMVKGRWRGGDSMIVFGRAKGSETFFLLNGQHRLHAIVQSGVAVEIVLAYVEYDNARELDEAYAIFDTSRRSDNDRLRAIGTPTAIAVPTDMFTRSVSALRFIYSGGSPSGNSKANRDLRDPMELDSIIRKWEPEIVLGDRLTHFSTLAERSYVRRAPTLAAIMLTLRYFPASGGGVDAWDFWKPLIENDGLKKGDPRHTYRANGLTMPASGPAHFDVFCRALWAFNAWRAGRELTMLRTFNKARLDGTPIQDGVNWVAIANKEF